MTDEALQLYSPNHWTEKSKDVKVEKTIEDHLVVNIKNAYIFFGYFSMWSGNFEQNKYKLYTNTH